MDATQTEVQLIKTQPEVRQFKTDTQEVVAPHGVLFLIPVGFACAWAIAVALSSAPKLSREKKLSLKRHSKIPCRNCQFYNNNPYVRCAIRPTDALTEQAIECSDFSAPNQQGRSS
ncbi:MAG TPA: hypothetical protein V6D18_02960 [Thermosynechococcaceae cyanobacterium]